MGTPAGRLAGLDGKPGVSPDHLMLESRLLDWRESLLPTIRSSYPQPPVTDEQLAGAGSSGDPLATLIAPLPAPDLLSWAVSGFLDAVTPAKGVAGGLAEWLDAYRSSDPMPKNGLHADLEHWFMAAWTADSRQLEAVAAKAKLTTDQMEWAGRQLARPFFHRLGELLAAHQQAEPEAKMAPGCPCCGGPPRLGLYSRQEGRRFLWCDLCNIKWPFLRVTCAFCLNRNHEKLGYLTMEGLDGYRIDVCEVCKGYLRAADERGRPEDRRTDFLLEDVGTFHLCVVAEEQGWRQGRVSHSAEARTDPNA